MIFKFEIQKKSTTWKNNKKKKNLIAFGVNLLLHLLCEPAKNNTFI